MTSPSESQSTSRGSRSVDVAVIGAGTAGLAAYRAAHAVTANVVIIEAGVYGTTCARVGCMPSKLLIAAADAAHHARHAGPFGVKADVSIDGRAVMDRVRRERDRFVGFVVEGVEAIPGDHKVIGRARFLAPGKLDVSGQIIEAKSVVVATGSAPVIPPMFERVRSRVVLNDDVFSWESLPKSVAVFGAGVIGLELGQALARLGVRVRLFGRGGTVGPLTDPDVRKAALAALSQDFPIDTEARVNELRPSAGNDGVEIEFREGDDVRTETFEFVLVAAGRKPRLSGLDLEKSGASLDARGYPAIDRYTLQAGSTSLFVAGDANEDVPLLHEAADEGRIAGENAARFPDVAPGIRRSLLAITFTEPNLAVVGATYASLASRSDVAIGRVSFVDQGRSRVMLQNQGAMRVYGERGTRRFLGAEIAGPRGEHLAHLLAWAHQQRLTIPEMLCMPFYHPVVEEGLRTALRDLSANLDAVPASTEART